MKTKEKNIIFTKKQINGIYSIYKSGKIKITKDTFDYLYSNSEKLPSLSDLSLYIQINISIYKTLKNYKDKD